MPESQPDPRSDEELVEAFRSGDESAFEAIYDRYHRWVAALACRFTGNREDALDVLQETFAYLVGKFPGFELRARLTTFLYPAVKHLAARARRWRKREFKNDAALDRALAPESEQPAERAELATVLGSLPDPQREVVLLRFVDGLTLEEIALAIDVPLGTVKSRLHHAIRNLREDPRTRRYFEV